MRRASSSARRRLRVVQSLRVREMSLGESDASGRRAPVASDRVRDVPCDLLIAAIGGSPDRALFDLVLRNLLDNALRYSEQGEITCTLEGSGLIVADCGPGFAEADLAHVFDRFYTGPRGRHGLGLALVQHVCAASGWQVSAGNAATGGARVVVELGASLHRF